ncbi:hypothetical protein [Paraburkholderia nodosa]|uniref:hypothetical protein n=1 Tax=Paraburkholderia nodosa TaxID=392320 RepID=UPI0004BC2163|nr:hypothetical protein [Paraburkholderia nodosa]
MVNFICFLLWNLALLFAVRVGCWLIGCARPDLTLNGAHIFIGLMATALAFDTALTFLVFAEAGGPWQAHNPGETYAVRAFAYALAALMALLIAWHARRQASRKAHNGPPGAQEIETSRYSKSTLPM